eukprot:TRINITY_DN3398_c0_g1_i1.p1 TRINITY_DN3398_c0_g1~~TRINITY_DN3398_c0_g1_i1.p1  ORF type:complete len:362 (-),score=55.03 TRINITY_DN3398_c0_g1_i1:275-1360(-)
MGGTSSRPRRTADTRGDEETGTLGGPSSASSVSAASTATPSSPSGHSTPSTHSAPNAYPAPRPNAAHNNRMNPPFQIPTNGMYYGPHFVHPGHPFYMPDALGMPPFAQFPFAVPQRMAQVQTTKTIKSDINLKKDSIHAVKSSNNPMILSLKFSLDAKVPCVITVYYFAKEANQDGLDFVCDEGFVPFTIPVTAGLNQSIEIPFDKSIDTSKVERLRLLKAASGEQSPVVLQVKIDSDQLGPDAVVAVKSQTTFVSFVSCPEGDLEAKVMRQEIKVGDNSYVLHEIYGIDHNGGASEVDDGKECIVCMTDARTTAVLPCRHMCLCDHCVEDFRKQSDKCPICRCAISSFLKIDADGSQQTR